MIPSQAQQHLSKGVFDDGLQDILKECGFHSKQKVQLFAKDKLKIHVRVENIADHFDSDQEEFAYVNVLMLC